MFTLKKRFISQVSGTQASAPLPTSTLQISLKIWVIFHKQAKTKFIKQLPQLSKHNLNGKKRPLNVSKLYYRRLATNLLRVVTSLAPCCRVRKENRLQRVEVKSIAPGSSFNILQLKCYAKLVITRTQ